MAIHFVGIILQQEVEFVASSNLKLSHLLYSFTSPRQLILRQPHLLNLLSIILEQSLERKNGYFFILVMKKDFHMVLLVNHKLLHPYGV